MKIKFQTNFLQKATYLNRKRKNHGGLWWTMGD